MELIIIDDDINIIFEENYKVLFALIYINKKLKKICISFMFKPAKIFNSSPFKGQSFLEKTPLSIVHNF